MTSVATAAATVSVAVTVRRRRKITMQVDYGLRELLIACVVGFAVGSAGIASLLRAHGRRSRLQRARQLKSDKLRDTIARWKQRAISEITEERCEAIVSLHFAELQNRLQSGQLTAVEVLRAYQRKAAIENDKYNFVCEPVAEAEELARACDQVVDKGSKQLLGIPLSVKETIRIKGYDCTFGLSSRVFQPSDEDSAEVKVMISQGAVPFIRTNISQTTWAIDSHNPIYGYTVNPCDPKKSCGGSSGGEGSALGCRASIAGLGSDLGGSLRIPAAWCGVCSLRPTSIRSPWPCLPSFCSGQNIAKVVTGPMARDVDGLVTLAKAFFSPEMHTLDPYMANAPFSTEIYTNRRRLRIGYFVDNGFIEESCSSARAVAEAKAALEKRGHELVPWTPPKMEWAAFQAFFRSIFGDSGETFVKQLQDDEVSPILQEGVKNLSRPIWLRKLFSLCMRPLLPSYLYDYIQSLNGTENVAGWWTLQEDVDLYRKETIASWQKAGLDAVLCPAMPCPAMPLGNPPKAFGVVCYTLMFNLLNFPAGVLPFTKVSEADEEHDLQHYPAKDMWHCVIKESLKGTVGLPVAVQCATLPLQEELCLRLMKEIEECTEAGLLS